MQIPRRGNETRKHLVAKPESSAFLRHFGADIVLCEHNGGDVVARRTSPPGTLVLEFERSKRNVLRNVTRDFEQGATAVLVECPDFATAAEVARALDRSLPRELREKTGLMTSATLRVLKSFCPQVTSTKNEQP